MKGHCKSLPELQILFANDGNSPVTTNAEYPAVTGRRSVSLSLQKTFR